MTRRLLAFIDRRRDADEAVELKPMPRRARRLINSATSSPQGDVERLRRVSPGGDFETVKGGTP